MAAKAAEKGPAKSKHKVLSVRVEEEVMKRFRHYCVDADLSGPEVVTRWIMRNCPARPAAKEATPCVSD